MKLAGIRLTDLNIKKGESGLEVTGRYDLLSDRDTVLATQGFNGYSDIKVSLSSETKKSLYDFHDGLKKDVETTLGFTKE